MYCKNGSRLTWPATLLVLTLPALTCLSGTAAPPAKGLPAPQDPIAALLAREIIGPVLPTAQWQRYCDARVPRMKSFASAAQWDAEADRLRTAVFQQVLFRGEAARWRDAKTKIVWLETIPGGPGYRIKKLRYEALPGFWIPALLYEPEKLVGKVPVIMNVNGHAGPPGKSVPYKQIRCINQAKRGMLALNVEWIGMGQLGTAGYIHARMNQLDLCGTSGLAPFYLSMTRGIDLLLSLENADPERVAVTGLSGGGWQTIFISGLDTRVTLSNPVAGYSSFLTRSAHFKDLGDSEQTPSDLATVVDYTHLTAMRAPRATLLTFNSKDNCCFESVYALQPLMDAARPIFELYGKPNALRSHVNDDPGTHNYELDNRQAFYRMLGDFFYPGDKQFDPKEIPSDKEVKTKEQLLVELPADCQDFHTLALAVAKDLPRTSAVPGDPAGAQSWRQSQRARLRELIRMPDLAVRAIKFEGADQGDIHATFWKLQMGDTWTVPAVELVKGRPQRTAILLADGGRKSSGAEAQRLLQAGYRVIAMDPIGIGESAIAKREALAAMLVAAVGERPLGLQAAQIAAAARWSAAQCPGCPVSLVARGSRASAWSLIAAAIEEKSIAGVELHDSLGSFKEIVDQNWDVGRAPELFCFGLFEAFDIPQLVAMVAPRSVARAPKGR